MKAGGLIEVIRVQRATATLNAAGTPATTWSDLATLRAEVLRETAEEFIRARGAVDEPIVVFRTHYLAGITTADRVAFRGAAYNIREVAPIGRTRGLELRCVASHQAVPAPEEP